MTNLSPSYQAAEAILVTACSILPLLTDRNIEDSNGLINGVSLTKTNN